MFYRFLQAGLGRAKLPLQLGLLPGQGLDSALQSLVGSLPLVYQLDSLSLAMELVFMGTVWQHDRVVDWQGTQMPGLGYGDFSAATRFVENDGYQCLLLFCGN